MCQGGCIHCVSYKTGMMTESTDINWYSNDTATFGDRVAAAREAQSLSQSQLARHLGVATRTVEAWENDLSEPRANKLQMLSGVLNVSMPWVLTGEGEGVVSAAGKEAMSDILTEVRSLRADMLRGVERLSVLEKRLRTDTTPQELVE